MSELEKLQIQYNHAKKVKDKEKVEQLKEQIDKLTPIKTNFNCSTCKNRVEKILNNGFHDFSGYYCTKLESELTIDTPIPEITDYKEFFKLQSEQIITINENTSFTRHFKHGNFLDTERVHDCKSHSDNNVPAARTIKIDPTKPFHSYPLLFTFTRNYDKLEYDNFTTIRSINFNQSCKDAPNFPRGTIGRYLVCGKVATSLIYVCDWVDNEIQKFSLPVLQTDIAPDICNSKGEFVVKLNELYTKIYGHANNSLTTIKRLFFIQKIKYNEIQEYQVQKIEVNA
jgi:hypothetical protein